MESIKKYNNVFKWITFFILIIVSTTTLISLINHSVGFTESIPSDIYSINSFLCVTSIVSAIVYCVGLYLLKQDYTYERHKKTKKKDIKSIIKRIWPCILLVVFLGWTAVGCIQASMEASAEAALRDDIKSNDTKRNKEIAAWTPGDRMINAADRSWNGCDNLKDGYFSFLFYATVAMNVVLLGANSDNLKKWILRTLLISALVLVFISFVGLNNPLFFSGIVKFDRAIFNNSNHYGYYLCISTILCLMMFLKEKNIYFKVISFLGYVLTTYMLIVNNTFGAYLGVMAAIIFIFLEIIVRCTSEKVSTCKIQKDTREDILKATIALSIFVFFSFTITGASASVSVDNGVAHINTSMTSTFGGRAVSISESVTQTTIKKTTYSVSGENRIYNIDEKKMKLIQSEKDIDSKSEYYKFNGAFYKILEDNVTQQVRTPEAFSNKTIVSKNFEQLFKDIGIIFNFYDKKDQDTEVEDEKNIVLVSGETNSIKEDVNEKSGLTEEVSKTGSGRGETWIKCLDLIAQRPVFGWGLENLLNEFYFQYGINEGRTHNLILQLAGTTGVFGMLFYMVAVIAIFFKVLFNHSNWGLIEYVTVPIFIAYMVSSMFGNSAFYTSPYFMIILGMMIASMLFKENNKKEKVETEN